MERVIGGKKFIFKESMNFYTQLKLGDVYDDQDKGKIRQSDFIMSLLSVFIESIDGEKNIDKNIEVIKNIEDADDITTLTTAIQEVAEKFTAKQVKKKQK